MIRKVSYESQERREKQVLAALNAVSYTHLTLPTILLV